MKILNTTIKGHSLLRMQIVKRSIYIILFGSISFSCKKLIEIPPPSNSIVTEQSFKDSVNSVSSVLGVYSDIYQNNQSNLQFGSGWISIYCGMSADEIVPFNASIYIDQIFNNTLISDNAPINNLWIKVFSSMYKINACIEGINNSKGITVDLKSKLLGEMKFLRAFHNFYMVNLFGDIPLVKSTDWHVTATLPRIDKNTVYETIKQDLLDAEKSLPIDFSGYKSERVRATKWAAIALLSRVYLYLEDWDNAERSASSIINHSSLFLLPALENSFSKNNSGAILQWHQNASLSLYNVTSEGHNNLPTPGRNPLYFLSDQILNSFEQGDLRKTLWIKEHIYQNTVYSLSNKYKLGAGNGIVNGPTSEYYTVLRLAEQYLIRAEARAEKEDVVNSKLDLNKIRGRAALLDNEMTEVSKLKDTILHERQVEFFCEWGHRWLDLKRTNKVDEILTPIKPKWKSYQQIYPIPLPELLKNPNLIQNLGYGK